MAYRTEDHTDLSLFKNRLWKLMENRNIFTAKDLAKKLYENGYVKVKQRQSYADVSEMQNSAIAATEKKIQNHLKSDTAEKLQGEFLIAYCKLFSCSADYLIGNIDETTHSLNYISHETGLTERAIRNIQSMWLKYRTGEEIWSFDGAELPLRDESATESLSIQYDKALISIESLKTFWEQFGGLSVKYTEDPTLCLAEIIQEKQKKCIALSALNTLLSSSIGETILKNIYAYLHFEYEPTEEDLKITKEYNTRNGTNYECFIKGKKGYNVDAEYLNNAFLLSLQKNCMDLKKELTEKTER